MELLKDFGVGVVETQTFVLLFIKVPEMALCSGHHRFSGKLVWRE